METITNLAEFLTGIAEKKAYPRGLQLYLTNKKLGAEGANALAVALQSGQCPEGLRLNLSNNRLGAKGANALAMALQSGQCPPGLQLMLSGNGLGAEGAKALTMALQSGQCPPGLQLYLGGNKLGAEGAKALAVALQSGQCPQGLKFNLGYNGISAEANQILKTAWAVYYGYQQDNFINGMTLYQGHAQLASPINGLPREMVQAICSYILPATPVLAKMTEISTKVFRQQLANFKLADTSKPVKQLDNRLAAALSAKKLTDKAPQIKTAINNFVQQELASGEPQALVNSPTVGLLVRFHLLAGHKVSSLGLSPNHQPDEPKGQSSIKKIRL